MATDIARPESGPGSITGFGPRIGAFIIDAILANLLAIVFNGGYERSTTHSTLVLVAFLLIEFVFVSVASQTPGMRVAGFAVVRFDGQGKPTPGWVLARTLLLAVIIPAVIPDGTGRYMHDRAAGTIMVHTR